MDFFNYVRDNSENEEIEETSIIHSYLHFPHPESNSSVSDTFENDYPQEKIYRISSESSLNFSDISKLNKFDSKLSKTFLL